MKTYPSPQTVPARFHLPPERHSLTHKFSVSDFEGYVTVGLYDDGSPGELYITADKRSSTMGGILNAFAMSVSMGLQSGIPLSRYIANFKFMRFEPMGFTTNPEIRNATSIIDYIFKYLECRFPETEEVTRKGNGKGNGASATATPIAMAMKGSG